MKRILIFSGTSEGRKLAETLAGAGVPAVVCVATEYGREVMGPLPGILLHQGRMDRQQMQDFMEGMGSPDDAEGMGSSGDAEGMGSSGDAQDKGFLTVVDATHPFATEVSGNIRQAAAMQKLPYLRLRRDTEPDKAGAGNWMEFSTNEECRTALLRTEGNILLTTGSKELQIYCDSPELRERLYVRVLPSGESIALCRRQGLSGRQIIAMQGPFSEEMNVALLHQYQIRHLVTKESGTAGGFQEKASAAGRTGACLYVIGNPDRQEGLSFTEVCAELEVMAGVRIRQEAALNISLAGIGMGSAGTLTADVREKILHADYLFGAARLLSCVDGWRLAKAGAKAYPYYMAEDIIPVLDGILQGEAVVLFSGDSGFYSGCGKLYQALGKWKEGQAREIAVRVYPGISSVSYFAAACGVSWNDAELMSIHGRGGRDGWEAEVLSAIKSHGKVFLLVSGVEDVRAVGEMLLEHGVDDCRIWLGCHLSSPGEKIVECTPVQCAQAEDEGLYIMAFVREKWGKPCLTPWRRDGEFIRGRVPMTKEEVRELAVCKLRLTEDAVVYDIGSGTGSVAVEIAGQSAGIRVYAIEQNEEGIGLIRQNKAKFGLENISIIQGRAPDCLGQLPVPTHAFIGGSGGSLREILEALYRQNPDMRVVITAVTLETVGAVTAAVNELPVKDEEMIQLQVSRAKRAGSSHLMQAGNPVYICSFDFRGQF